MYFFFCFCFGISHLIRLSKFFGIAERRTIHLEIPRCQRMNTICHTKSILNRFSRTPDVKILFETRPTQ